MKKFKTPLTISGTPEELFNIVPKLKELGYAWLDCQDKEASRWYPFLITYYGTNYSPGLGYFYHRSDVVDKRVEAKNLNLVLALAAMVDSEKLFKGEYVLCTSPNINHFTLNKIYKVLGDGWNTSFNIVDDEGEPNGSVFGNHSSFRKATAEEIINHFKTQSNNMQQQDKKIIGYKVISDLLRWPAGTVLIEVTKNAQWGPKGSTVGDYCVGTDLINNTALFEPIYETPKWKEGDWVLYHKVSGDGVSNTNILKIEDLSRRGSWTGLLEPDFISTIKGDRYGLSFKGIQRFASQEEIESAQTKIITLSCTGGSFDLEVSKRGIFYRPDGKFLDIESLRGVLMSAQNLKVGKYDFAITHVDSGCKKNVPLADWKKAVDTYYAIHNAD